MPFDVVAGGETCDAMDADVDTDNRNGDEDEEVRHVYWTGRCQHRIDSSA